MILFWAGVSQIIVAVNKMDTIDWAQDRYEDIVKKLKQFLKTVGFKEADLFFIPCSGLVGENLTASPSEPLLTSWYSGPNLVEQIGRMFCFNPLKFKQVQTLFDGLILLLSYPIRGHSKIFNF